MKRSVVKILLCILSCSLIAGENRTGVEQWDTFELSLTGPADGNPFTEVELHAVFRQGSQEFKPEGFYDGDGNYKIRFMPDRDGAWTYQTISNRAALNGQEGILHVSPPGANNHGPVHVANTFHFAYADGRPFRQIGTTCYAWIHQDEQLEQQTLKTLATAPFNKVRMCVFPKRYEWNRNEPRYYPFDGTAPNRWDFSRFNPEFFRHLEQRIGQLRDLGIEADVILFHPYDRGHWGFDRMPAQTDDRYLRYVIARLSAYRNVWWSLANEYDFMKEKSASDWDRFFRIVQVNDPYGHLRSIHNGTILYSHWQPWVTHVSIQNGAAVNDFGRAELYRDVYNKPIIFDEVRYEGNIPNRWGTLRGEELVLRFWMGLIAGTYVGHGETIIDPNDVLWWSKGGVLKGHSPSRLEFLRRIMEDSPAEGIDPIDKWQDYPFAGRPGIYYLGYFGRQELKSWPFQLYKTGLRDGMRFTAEVIDTWNMTVIPVDGVFTIKKKDNYYFADQDGRSITLPERPYMAIRIKAIRE